MQTRDEVEGLHNCLEFSQPLSCLYQAMQTRKRFLWLNYETMNTLLPLALIRLNYICPFLYIDCLIPMCPLQNPNLCCVLAGKPSKIKTIIMTRKQTCMLKSARSAIIDKVVSLANAHAHAFVPLCTSEYHMEDKSTSKLLRTRHRFVW